ncbi:MAG: pilus assembly protein PilM, partial [Gammaproteobacteria bacterium]
PVGDYQLLVVNTPEVPAPELRSAIRWLIHDMIDYHVDDAVLDVFDAPPGGPNNLQQQMYVVVARSTAVKQRIDRLEQAGVNLEIIDIPELAMRNIAASLPEDENGLLMLHFDRDECIITITRQGNLYLTRTLDIGYRQLQETAADPQPLVNRLTLEIQRSMDYFERHFQLAPVRSLVILPPPLPVQDIADALQGMLGITTRILKLGEVVECDSEPEATVAAQYLLATGAALRTETVAL